MFGRRSKTPSAKEVAAAVEARTWASSKPLTAAEEARYEANSQAYYANVHRLRTLCPMDDHTRCRSH